MDIACNIFFGSSSSSYTLPCVPSCFPFYEILKAVAVEIGYKIMIQSTKLRVEQVVALELAKVPWFFDW